MSTWTLVAALVPTGGPAFVAGSPPSGNAIVAVRSPARMGHLASPRMALGAGAGGGDLAGGSDPERNAQLAALRSMFGAGSEAPAANAAGDAARLGLHLDLPLCRFSWAVLPHHQVALNIWQPQYTLMFSKLLAQPPPRYYLHVLLPGGAESLGKPEYALRPGTRAPLHGTLMELAYGQREEDSRLSLVARGLGRGVVLRETQALPYARGDVQLLPDGEALLAAALAAERYLRCLAAEAGAGFEPRFLSDGVRRRLAMAAAVGEGEAYFEYEASRPPLDAAALAAGLAPLNQLNASAAPAVVAGVPAAVRAALDATPMAPAVCYRPEGWERPAEAAGDSDVSDDHDDLYEGSAVLAALQAAVDDASDASAAAAAGGAASGAEAGAGAGAGAEAEAEAEQGLLALEVQLWLELDELLRTLRALGANAGVPSQILGLLPPAPTAGWPTSFKLARLDAQMRHRFLAVAAEAEAAGGGAGSARALAYVPADATYPPRKRAERLSWVVWAVIGSQTVGVNSLAGSPLQAVVEAPSTAERLRLALLRLRELKQELAS